MLKIIAKYTVYLLVFLIYSTAYAEENFCLDKKGFILPIFEQTNCETSAEIKINEKEFMHIIEFDESIRITELENYRKNQIEVEKTKSNVVASNSEEDLTIEIQNESDEHLVCFESGLLGTALSNIITDSDGTYPIGIQSEWIVNSKANGTMIISLKHQPDGLKNGSCDVGETDVEIEFPVVIN